MSGDWEMRDDRSLAARAWLNECRGWLALGGLGDGRHGAFEIEEVAGLICAWWRGEDRWTPNLLLAPVAGGAALGRALEAVAERAEVSDVATTLRVLEAEDPADQDASLARLGYAPRERYPLMALPLPRAAPDPPQAAGVSAHRVRTEEDAAAALLIARSVYRDPPGLTEFFGPPGPVRAYLARRHGAPAATASLWPFAGVAGVFSVATSPEHRRRGAATAAIRALLRDAEREGFGLAALRTMPDLLGMYSRLGFTVVGHTRHYRRGRSLGQALELAGA